MLMETGVDLARLRAGRLRRLQAAMRQHDVEACLLFNPANVRYATGATTMTVYCLGSFVRCALVPVEGRPVLFEHPNSMHLFSDIEADVRPFHAWEFYDDAATEAATWARQIVDAMEELGVESRKLAVDKLAPVALRALQHENIDILESGTITMDAREVKTPEELRLFELNGGLVIGMLDAFQSAIAPGVREQDLVAVITDSMLRAGGEYLITRGVASGTNTNPWRQESNDRALEDGDVVFVDTDVNGIEGYFYCVSRTFVCGDRDATPEQKETYRMARDWVERMRELLKPGASYREIAEKAPRLPARFNAQRYECIMHSCGLEDEGPSILYADASQPNPERVLKEDMVVVSEVYLGEPGASFGVKLGDQFLLTADDTKNLSPYPLCTALL
jgi:Xaa-Pro aminopeptidase